MTTTAEKQVGRFTAKVTFGFEYLDVSIRTDQISEWAKQEDKDDIDHLVRWIKLTINRTL
jgi:hypothetical protein